MFDGLGEIVGASGIGYVVFSQPSAARHGDAIAHIVPYKRPLLEGDLIEFMAALEEKTRGISPGKS